MTKLCLASAALCYLVLVALAIRPAFDLDAATLFYAGGGHFVGDTRLGIVARYALWAFPFVLYAAMLLAALGARFGLVAPGRAPRGRRLVFLTLSLAIGPGVLVHGTLKEISHRPRPYNVARFEGRDTFRPFYRFDGACRDNCSFPSGEAAAATWMLAPASLAPPPWRVPALVAALVYAIGTGVWRMAFGAHFLSDVCGAIFLTILTILAVRSILGVGR